MNNDRIIWVVGYPKSGTTWLRSLLTAYRHEDASVDIGRLDIFNAANRRLIDQALGIATSDLTHDELRAFLPTAFKVLAKFPGGPHFVKTHDSNVQVRDDLPLFPHEITQGIIHIVRDPRDVAVSARHYWGITQDEAIEALNNPDRWILHSDAYLQLPIFLSDWSTHTESWLNAAVPVFTLRYEDLLSDTVANFSRLLDFCDLKLDHKQVIKAVDACDFSNLQKQEQRSGYHGLPHQASAPFFRQGKAGGWKEVLTSSQNERIIENHEVIMRSLGYIE